MLTNALLLKISITLVAILALLSVWFMAQMKPQWEREARQRQSEERVRKYQANEPTGVKLDPDHWRHFDFNFDGAQNPKQDPKQDRK
jgi:membrane protein implicated in regulation of membrane protease activity